MLPGMSIISASILGSNYTQERQEGECKSTGRQEQKVVAFLLVDFLCLWSSLQS